MSEGPWIEWAGGECPCPEAQVLLRMREAGETDEALPAIGQEWRHAASLPLADPRLMRHRRKFDIVFFRIVEA